MKHKRVLTDEQRQAIGARLRAGRIAKAEGVVAVEDPEPIPLVKTLRDPEVEAVIATMDPMRRAKLQNIQARQLAQLSQTKEGREALERLEARHNGTTATTEGVQNIAAKIEKEEIIITPIDPPKPIVREIPMKAPFRLTGSQSGLMVSELGPCQCGEAKLRWHPICLRVKV